MGEVELCLPFGVGDFEEQKLAQTTSLSWPTSSLLSSSSNVGLTIEFRLVFFDGPLPGENPFDHRPLVSCIL